MQSGQVSLEVALAIVALQSMGYPEHDAPHTQNLYYTHYNTNFFFRNFAIEKYYNARGFIVL